MQNNTAPAAPATLDADTAHMMLALGAELADDMLYSIVTEAAPDFIKTRGHDEDHCEALFHDCDCLICHCVKACTCDDANEISHREAAADVAKWCAANEVSRWTMVEVARYDVYPGSLDLINAPECEGISVDAILDLGRQYIEHPATVAGYFIGSTLALAVYREGDAAPMDVYTVRSVQAEWT